MIGKKIVEPGRIDSTNAYADKLLLQGLGEHGDVIWAHEQFAGRGQHDHTWVSEAGKNLTFTVILRPDFIAPDRQFLLNKVVSLAVVDFIGDCLLQTSRFPHPVAAIKWPNDIYLDDKKIGGILIENKIMGATLETSLAGIGVNINQEHFPPEIPNPVSLVNILHRETVLKVALLSICRHLDLRYSTLRNSGPATLDPEFARHLLGFEEWRIFTCNNHRMEGKIRGVNNLGQLLVETRTGELLAFSHGEIEYVI